jgi:hypothetical protein
MSPGVRGEAMMGSTRDYIQERIWPFDMSAERRFEIEDVCFEHGAFKDKLAQ